MRRPYWYAAISLPRRRPGKDEAQRSIRTFYEAVIPDRLVKGRSSLIIKPKTPFSFWEKWGPIGLLQESAFWLLVAGFKKAIFLSGKKFKICYGVQVSMSYKKNPINKKMVIN